jgi:hypothetical protein
VDWSKTGIRDSIRKLLEQPNWGEGLQGTPAGCEVPREIIQTYYAKKRSSESYRGCSSYEVMTPEHLHAAVSIAAMKKDKHVVMHKPIANRVHAARLVVETARKTGVATHLLAWRSPSNTIRDMILDGAIGILWEVHNWTNRPFWPQWQSLPTERPPVPKGFNWDLWLGPALGRPYHPCYTHTVFRGWYDFGGGSIADIGKYSLWPIFMALDLPVPTSSEANVSSCCDIVDQVSGVKMNDFSFPNAARIRFKFPAHGPLPPLHLYWYEGGKRSWTPEELEAEKRPMPATGTMFVGDKGIMLGNDIIPTSKMREYRAQKGGQAAPEARRGGGGGESNWV